MLKKIFKLKQKFKKLKNKVGYTMRDIRYFWRDGLNSVGMSSEVELPQFRVLGHRQRATEINLTTGTHTNAIKKKSKLKKFFLSFPHKFFFIFLTFFCLSVVNTKNVFMFMIFNEKIINIILILWFIFYE